ncbi:MAG: ATP-binding cassette domain-containing protein [Inquilinaceae bacterium]
MQQVREPIVQMRNIQKRFGGVHAVDGMSVDIYPGEVLGLLGHNGAGKSTLVKILSGAYPIDSGEIRIAGEVASIETPRDAKAYGIETIYQTLALADNLATPANIFFGREILTRFGALDEAAMEHATINVMKRLNPNFRNFHDPVSNLSGGQRQSVAIARTLQFNARIIIMDEPTAALGPHETQMVANLIKNLKAEGIAIVMISHDLHDVFDLADRISVMKNGRHVWTGLIDDTDKDEVLQMIILGKLPDGSYAPGIISETTQ